jgi:subtilase family serine protease
MLRKTVCIGVTKLASYFLLLSTLLCSCADLVVKDVHYEVWLTDAYVVKGTVENQGRVAADESITKIERTDPFVEVARVATPSLGPGESKELTLWYFSASLLRPGSSLHVRVCADADNTINEQSESNNCLTKSFVYGQ